MNARVEFLENKIQIIEDSQKIQSAALKDKVVVMQPKEIVLSVLDSSLKGGKEVTLNRFKTEIAHAVLGEKKAKSGHSGKALRAKLGYSKNSGFLSWLVKLSKNNLNHRIKGGKVFIRYG